jgi:hypothetical protein
MTLDGAKLCDGILHITTGIKITDRRAIDPRDGSPLCSSIDGLVGRIFKVQSPNYCFTFRLCSGKIARMLTESSQIFFVSLKS